jgi:diacylglycerol O-acyltransferase
LGGTLDQQLDGLDSAFLAVETHAAHMHMTGLVTLEPSAQGRPAAFEEIRAHLAPRLGGLPVFRRHLHEVPLGLDRPVWVERDFDLDAHLHRIAAPAPGSAVELAAVVGHLAALPLDRTRPLWDLWVIEELDHGRTALLANIHHALMDGVAGAEIFGRLFDLDPNTPAIDERVDRPPRSERTPSKARLLLGAARSLAGMPYRFVRQTLGTAAATVRGLRDTFEDEATREREPVPTPSLAAPDTPLNGAITARREVALGSLSLEELQRLKRGFDVTLNDVVLAVCSGALRRYLSDGGELSDEPLVAAIPVSVASGAGERTSGNQVSAMTVDLPVQLADPVGRLANVHRSTLRAKRAQRAAGGDLLSGWAEVPPPALLSGASELYSRFDLAERHPPVVNLIISNVPGPPRSLYCAGHRVQACHPMGPIYEGCALNLTVLSYDGRLHFGLLACPDVVPELSRIAAGLHEALDELREAAGQRDRLPGAKPGLVDSVGDELPL